MTKFFETIAFVMLFAIIPSSLLAINTTLMNIKIEWFDKRDKGGWNG